ncbi:MAG TPA: DUF1549 domain-containing protein [Gemmataceae bacterium]|nr:DUF1549 domain-containing protein [Gemmataceae bacterium]
MIRLPLARTAVVGVLALGLAASAAAQDAKPGVSQQTQKINELIAKSWADGGVKKHAANATDLEFCRRVFIDLIGRIPTPEEIRDFEQDGAGKRTRLVNRLMYAETYMPKGVSKTVAGAVKFPARYSDEYTEHWANLWTVWLMTRTGHPLYRDQMRTWLEIQFSKNASHKEMVTKLLTATGKSNEVGAVNFIVHHLGDALTGAEKGKFGNFDAVPITSRVTKLFLGLQTQCTQCHDHPFAKEWVQSDFWGVNAFFRQTVRSATPSAAPGNGNNGKMDNPVQITLSDVPELNTDGIVLYERRDGKRMASYPVMLKDIAQAEKGELSAKRLTGATSSAKNRRQQLAEWVVSHDNFNKAYVNRVWGHLFGRGLNKEPSIDDFSSNNEVVHPELLAYLAEEFGKYGHDPKKLLEWICTSEVYQLSHVAAKDSADPKFDPYFARMQLKALSPEVLFESLMVATKAEVRSNADQRKALRDRWMQKLVRNFGDDEGNELSFNGTVVQALLMMNGSELNGEIGASAGRKGNAGEGNAVVDAIKKRGGNPSAIYDELFLMTVSRHPTAAEIAKLEGVRNGAAAVKVGAEPPKKGPNPKGPAGGSIAVGASSAQDLSFYQDVFWALLNTNEFMLNH